MRLTDYQSHAIKEVIKLRDPEAEVYLFGSRVDDGSRGGDIDLLVLTQMITEKDRRHVKLELFERLGEQKIDLIIAKNLDKPFARLAYTNGLLL